MKIPRNQLIFSANLSLKILQNLTNFLRDLSEALNYGDICEHFKQNMMQKWGEIDNNEKIKQKLFKTVIM